MIHRDRQLEGNNVSTVAAVRDGVNQPNVCKDHAEFIGSIFLFERDLFGKPKATLR
jgi:hypothetical protein